MDQGNALETIRGLASLAAEKMRQILNDPKNSQYAKIQVIILILKMFMPSQLFPVEFVGVTPRIPPG